MNLFILDKNFNVLDILSNTGDFSKIIPYYEDLYTQDLATGAETFEFTVSSNNEKSKYLTVGNYIAFRYNGDYKLFNIISTEETHEESLEKNVYCEMAGIELINHIIRPMKVVNNTVQKFLKTILEDTDWQVGKVESGLTDVIDFEIKEHSTVYELIQQHVVGTFGVEIAYRVKIENNEVTAKYIDIYGQRGNENGYRFAYSKNIDSISRTIDSSELVTALIGEGKDGLTFKEVDLPDKPVNQDFIADENAYKQWNIKGNHLMGVHKCETDSAQELLRLTRIALKERSQPKAKYEVKVALIDDNLKIGDTVNIVDHEFNPPLYLSGRVSQLKISSTDPSKNECILSNFKELNSNITDEMRRLASQLEGYVDSQFPIGGDKIQNGAVGKEQFSKQYHTEIVADAVYASLLEVDEIVANKVDVEQLNAIYASIEDLEAKKATIEELKAQKAEIEELVAKKADIESLKAIVANIETLYTDKANVTDLNALKATIETLKADKADIEDLTAQRAEIEEIIAKKASIESLSALEIKVNTIDAGKANIEDLKAVNAQIDSLKANKADIVDLDAVKADIGTLNADIANINSLVNGNLTSENIHSLILSSDKVTVEDAFIKDAMIDSINANKIKAGSISTNNVTIESKTGGIRIANNTQQFRDANGVVRVQIGEDKNGGFNFSIMDETGQGVLIDHTGVKESALADDIIKSDMIASDAVGEKQIDYNSFATGFNKDTNTSTLKATKVKLDSQNQSLEVGFNNLKTQSDDTKSKTESNSTKLSVQQGQIQTLISDTTIEKDGQSIKIKDVYSELEQTVDSFGVTMGEHTSKITEIDGKVGTALTKADNAISTANGLSGKVTEVESKQSKLEQSLDGFKTTVSKDYSTKTELKATNDKLGSIEGTVNNTSSKVSSLETNLEGITQRVSSTETTTETLTKKVGEVEKVANDANEKVEGIDIGSTNLLTKSNDFSTMSGYGGAVLTKTYNVVVPEWGDKKGTRIVASGGTDEVKATKNNNPSIKWSSNDNYTISIWVKNNSTNASVTIRGNGMHSFTKNDGTVNPGESKRIVVTGKGNTSSYMQLNFQTSSVSDEIDITIRHAKIEKGNKVTDWSPAPEDIQEQIDATKTEISSTKSKVSSIETNLSGITSRVGSVETKTTTLEGKVTSQEARLQTAEQKITDKAIINTVSSTIDSKVNQGINNIQIGGKNLLICSDFEENTIEFGWFVFEGTMVEGYLGNKAINIDNSAATSGYVDKLQQVIHDGTNKILEPGQWYTFSFYTKGTGKVKTHIHPSLIDTEIKGVVDGKDTTLFVDGGYDWNLTNAWTRHTYTFKTKSVIENVEQKLLFRVHYGNNVDICMPQLEKGTKASDWGISQEDIEKKISETETLLNGNIDSAISDAQQNILDNVDENYTSKDDFDTLSETVSTKFEQTSEDISMQFETAQSYTKEVDGKLETFQNTVGTHIRFSENGIDLGKTNSPFTATLDNTKLAFKQDEEEVAYISNNKMHITNAEVKETLRVGTEENGFFTWAQSSNGNLSLKWSDK